MARKVLIGLDKFYYALLNSDTTAGVSYQTPTTLKGAMTVSYNPNSTVSTLFADDGPYDTAEAIGEIDLEVGIADISQEDYAALLGHTITGGVMAEDNDDQPVDCAFGFRAKRSNGGYSYYWFLKGKFSKPSMDHQTKADTITWQTPSMMWKGVCREYDGKYKYSTRDDADDYTTAIATAWFSSVYGTTADTTAPTFSSSVPSANSTSATQTSNITLTFSEPILSSTVTAANLMILQVSSASTVSASLSVSSSTVTMTISSILTASTSYSVVMGIGLKDEAGNSLSAPQTFEFTTSA
jgi:phi13 family phage major tail protein